MVGILIIDDAPDNRSLMKMMINRIMGDNIKIIVPNDVQRFQNLLTNKPHLIQDMSVAFIDYKLGPGRTCIPLVKLIKRFNPYCKIVLVTGWCDQSDLQSIHYDYILEKPYKKPELRKILYTFLKPEHNEVSGI